jgi:hypothetical protein
MQMTHKEYVLEAAQLTWLAESIDEEAAAAQSTIDEVDVGRPVRGRRYKQGLEPAQPMLLPPSVDDQVAADNPVCAIAAYNAGNDLGQLVPMAECASIPSVP